MRAKQEGTLAARRSRRKRILRLAAIPEEAERDLERRERRYREEHSQKPHRISPRGHRQEDQDRRDVQGAVLYPGLQHVARKLLNDQVEQDGQKRGNRSPRWRKTATGYGFTR